MPDAATLVRDPAVTGHPTGSLPLVLDGGRLIVAIAVALVATQGTAHAASLTDGKARFTVITPSLVRLQYADDGAFDNDRTQVTDGELRSSGSLLRAEAPAARIVHTASVTAASISASTATHAQWRTKPAFPSEKR